MPGAPPHLGMMQPIYQQVTRKCGVEYQESDNEGGGDVALCGTGCGTGSIGICTVDNMPVCGFHSKLRDDRRMCDRHADEFDAAARKRQIDLQVRDTADRLISDARVFLDGLGKITQPLNRWVAVVLARTSNTIAPALNRAPMIFQQMAQDDIARVLSEFEAFVATGMRSVFPGDQTGSAVKIGSGRPSEWAVMPSFIGQLVHARILTGSTLFQTTKVTDGMFGRKKTVVTGQLRGWLISAGSHGVSHGQYGSPSVPGKVILEDGTRGSISPGSTTLHSWSVRQPLRFSDYRVLSSKGFLPIGSMPESLKAMLDVSRIR